MLPPSLLSYQYARLYSQVFGPQSLSSCVPSWALYHSVCEVFAPTEPYSKTIQTPLQQYSVKFSDVARVTKMSRIMTSLLATRGLQQIPGCLGLECRRCPGFKKTAQLTSNGVFRKAGLGGHQYRLLSFDVRISCTSRKILLHSRTGWRCVARAPDAVKSKIKLATPRLDHLNF
jgi:hypothetical protein